MRHKQFKISILVILGLGLTIVQAQNMNIKVTSGTSTAFVINETQKLTFNEGNLVITKKDGATSSFALLDIRHLNFAPSTGLNDPKQGTNTLTMYPNPVQDRLTICFANGTSGWLQINVFKFDGKMVYSQSINSQQNENHNISVSEWQNGMYLIRIDNGIEIVSSKFMKN